MGFRQKMTKYFSGQAETKDQHSDPACVTLYYKTTKHRGLETLVNFLKNSPDFDVHAVSEEHGEISFTTVRGRKTFIVATVIMVRPYRTAIDFSVTTDSLLPFDFGYSTKVIRKLYEHLNKTLIPADQSTA